MPNANRLIPNTASGELSPGMFGRVDLPITQRSLARCENFITRPQGSATFRSGGVFVGYTRRNRKAAFIPFQFSDQQAYLIEATDLKFRFYKDNGIITETPKTLESMTFADPGVFTITAHGFSNDDEIFLDGTGITGLSGNFLVTDVTTDTFQLTDVFGVVVNTLGLGSYTGGATAAKVYEIDTPYTEEHLEFLQYAQTADTMYLVHQEYEPGKLIREGHANWTLDNNYTRTGDFIVDEGDYPRAVTFNDSGRLLMGGTKNHPETIYASKAPSNGDTDFDDFADGVNATDAIIFTLAPLHGKVDSIQWLAMTSKFLVAGGFGSVRRIYGSTQEEPIQPTAITAKSVNTFGCAYALPVANGEALFYIERSSNRLRSLEYDIQIDGYVATDRNLVAEHISYNMKQAIEQQSVNGDIVWCTRQDGKLIGLTYKEKEDISGWHRHYVGGRHINSKGVTIRSGKVSGIGNMPRPDKADQLWMIVERYIPAYGTVRSVEYMEDAPIYPNRDDFYTGMDAEVILDKIDDEGKQYRERRNLDYDKYYNALFEIQKDAVHLDMSIQYNGSDLGIDSLEVALPITDITQADPGVVTVTAHGYTSGDVVYITGVEGMTQINNQFYEVVVIDANTFSLIGNDIVLPAKPKKKGKKKKKKDGNQEPLNGPVDTTDFDAYTMGGTVARLGVSLDIGATTGSSVTFHASGPVFTADMVGRQIWKSYDINGDGGGRAIIRQVSGDRDVLVDIIEDEPFDSMVQIPPGGWMLTTMNLSGLEHLKGETVSVIADGGEHIDIEVASDGTATLTEQVSIATVGLKYRGWIKTLNLDIGGVTGPAQGKLRNITEVGFTFLHTVGALFGTNPYKMKIVDFYRHTTDRPTPPDVGQYHIPYLDEWNRKEKCLHLMQDKPLPCTVLSMDIYMETSDE